ncbi:hypothetical protein [Flavobacterium sp.]|uniref:hypothetical protein n=1 Tax=Flavobacterium sp. TaxID=239 RepID=UPI0037C0BF28
MEYNVPCACGRSLIVRAGDAGTFRSCECGNQIHIPQLSVLRESPRPARRPVFEQDTMFRFPRQFRLIDLLFSTGIFAIVLTAFLAQIRSPFAQWTIAIYLPPAAIACLLHFRFRLRIISAVAVHCVTTMIWIFLHWIGRNAALNGHFASDTVSKLPSDLAIYATAWIETVQMILWTPLLAICYGTICYVTSRTYNRTLLAKIDTDLIPVR